MSSVIDSEKCPRCGGVLFIELNCRTLEEWEWCSRCGRRGGWHYLRDEDGNAILDSDKEPLKEFDNLIGFGTAYFQYEKVGVGQAFLKPDDTELKEAFYAELQNNSAIIKEKCYLSVWDDEIGDVKAEYGTLPETFDELEARRKEDVEE